MKSGYTSINGSLYISNSIFTDLSGLECLNSVGGLNIENNPNLTSLNGLSNLMHISTLYVWDNASLVNFDGLGNIQADMYNDIEIYIYDNDTLENLDGFDCHGCYVLNLVIENNKSLTDITSLNSIGEFVAYIGITNNDSLLSLNGLGAGYLDHISIDDNDSLINLEGLERLKYVDFGVSVSNNASLISLKGLDNYWGDGDFNISDNASLVSLDGLENLLFTESFSILNNSSLCEDDAESFKNEIAMRGYIFGDISIYGNKDCSIIDNCPNDPDKTEPGVCGCGIPDTDSDLDGIPNCIDNCQCDFEPVEGDSDVDGADLAAYLTDDGGLSVAVLAGEFGRIDCP